MQQLVVSIHPDLVEPASTRFLEGTLDETSYRVGGMDLETPDGIQYQLQLTNTGEGIVLSGEASCTAITPCTRCLVPTRTEVSGAVEGYYLLEASEDVDGYEDDEFEVIGADGSFDIAPAIIAALVYATPYVVLARKIARACARTAEQILTRGLAPATKKMRSTPPIPSRSSRTSSSKTSDVNPVGYKTYTCPHAARCGGCEWLSVPYPIQLSRKRAMLEELFEPLGCGVDAVIGMDEPIAYRHKIMTPYAPGREGKPRLGMYERGTHKLIEVRECLVEHKAGRPILNSIAELAQGFHIPAYDENTGRGCCVTQSCAWARTRARSW